MSADERALMHAEERHVADLEAEQEEEIDDIAHAMWAAEDAAFEAERDRYWWPGEEDGDG